MYKESYEDIKKRILENISIDVDRREGSFINDMISPLALELTKTYMEFNNILNIAFVTDSYGTYLDKKVIEFGVTRKEGERARGIIKITGTDGTIIPKGTIALANGLTFILEEGSIIDGEALVLAMAQEVGKKYNIIANSIEKLETDLYGVNAAINESDFIGGIDRETDKELKERFFNIVKKPQTSGNAFNYEQWALEVDGVGNAVVKPLWNGAGTVKILISDSNKQPVTQTIMQSCKEYIDSVRPIGATVTIVTPSLFNITVNVDIDIDNNKTIEEVTDLIRKGLIKYFGTCTDKIIYNKISGVIATTESVTDFRNLKINNGTVNVSIPAENIVNLNSLVVT